MSANREWLSTAAYALLPTDVSSPPMEAAAAIAAGAAEAQALGPTALGALLLLGVAMGAINNLAGAAGVLGLIALEDFAGLSAGAANASLRPSAVAIGLAGWIGFRSKGHHLPAKAWRYGLLAAPGALAGAALALQLPILANRIYLFAILLLVLIQQLRNKRPDSDAHQPVGPWVAALLFAGVGAHMGFIQVGTGLVATGALGLAATRELVSAIAMKMAIVFVSATTAIAVFAWYGQIVLVPALVLAVGCGTGSFLASRWAVDKGHGAVRAVVLTITTTVLLRLGWQFWAMA